MTATTDTDDRTVYQRVLAILDELPAIGKDQRNEQQKFMYRGHDDVMAALNPLLGKHGVFMVPRVIDRVATDTRTTGKGSTMYEVNLHVEYTFTGRGGDSFVASAWGEGTDMGDKATNKAMTMAFKNVIAQVFALTTHELSDADATSPEHTTSTRGQSTGQPPQRARSAPAARREFDPGVDLLDGARSGEGFLAKLGGDLKAIHGQLDWSGTVQPLMYQRFGVAHVSELTDEQAAEHWRRFANIAAKLVAEADPNALPPATDDQIREVIRWGYSTNDPVELVLQEQQPDPKELEAAEEAARAAAADGP